MYMVICLDDDGNWTLVTRSSFSTYASAERYINAIPASRNPKILVWADQPRTDLFLNHLGIAANTLIEEIKEDGALKIMTPEQTVRHLVMYVSESLKS